MKQRVSVGEELDLKAKLVEAKAKLARAKTEAVKANAKLADVERGVAESKTRRNITYGILVVGGTFLFGAAYLGLSDNNFGLLTGVWGTFGPVLVGLVGYYFGKTHR